MKLRLTLLMLLVIIITIAQNTTTIIHAGHLLDTEKGTWLTEMTVTIADGEIQFLDKGY